MGFRGALGRSDLDPAVRQRIAFVHICVCMWWHTLSQKAPEYIISNKDGRNDQEGYFLYVYEAHQAVISPFWVLFCASFGFSYTW